MSNRVFIPAHKAVIYWNDVPAGGLDDVLVVSLDDASVDRIAERFENSNGAIVDDWLIDPRSTPEAIFEQFMASEPVVSATPEFLAEIRSGWLLEFAKIDRCEWARTELANLPGDETPISHIAQGMMEAMSHWLPDYCQKIESRLRSVPDEDFTEFYLVVHAEYQVLGEASPTWMKLLMMVTDGESDRRRNEAARVERFAARHGMSIDQATRLFNAVASTKAKAAVATSPDVF